MSSAKSIPISRPLVGLIALACLATGGVLLTTQSDQSMLGSAFGRVGLLMGAFWLALPTKNRAAAWANVSPWTLAGGILLLVIVARFPRLLLPMIPVAIAVVAIGLLLRPRNRTPRRTTRPPAEPPVRQAERD